MRISLFISLVIFSSWCFAINTMQTKKAELMRVTHQIEQLQQMLHSDQKQQQILELQLQATDLSMNKLSQQIQTLNLAIVQEQKKLMQLKKVQHLSATQLQFQHNVLVKQIQSAYRLGQLPTLKILFNQDNPNRVARHLHYYHALNQAKLNTIFHIKNTLQKLNLTLQDISSHQQTLQNLLKNMQEQQANHQHALIERKNVIAQLNQHVANKQQQLTVLIANQKTLQDIVTHLQRETKTEILPGKPFKQLRGKLHWPVKGAFAAHFGSALDVGDQHLSGTIINAKQGTPVQAVYDGKVIFANWLRGFGLLLIINHGNDYMSLYARNHTLYAKVGESVKTGDTIATTGSSGGYNQSGLYFEIRQNGKAVDPKIWCR